jgi:prenyl protein peptidase
VTIAKVIIFAIAVAVVPTQSCLGISFWQTFGWDVNLNALFATLTTCGLMAVFYLGELIGNIMVFVYARYHVRNSQWQWQVAKTPVSWGIILKAEVSRLWQEFESNPVVTFRNILFAPISEELVFRGFIVPVIYMAYVNTSFTSVVVNRANSAYSTAWASIGWFGVAHMHHMIEKIRNGEPWSSALKVSLVQLTYTSIFGFIAALLFLRTGSIFPSIVSHIICNFVGLPDMGFMVPPPNFHQRMGCNYRFRYIILALHALGLILFSVLLFPCTSYFAKDSYFYNP